ncbi:MAG: S41 family peptidase [Clostridiales bacterium]|nr:S41 family peptidase [Clostridiales bacterium]
MKMFKRFCFAALMALCLVFGGCAAQPQPETGEKGRPIDAAFVARAVDEALAVMIEENFDAYAWYLTAEEYQRMQEDIEGSFGGIGVYMNILPGEEYPLIVSVMSGQPAEKAGVLAGDRIIAVDRQDVAGQGTEAVSAKVRGEKGTVVTLLLLGEDGKEREVRITRQEIQAVSVTGREIPGHPNIAYIAISSFTYNTPGEFRDVFEKMTRERQIDALIIDLRNNPGGSLSACLDIASLFVPKNGTLITMKTANGPVSEKSGGGRKITIPVVCLQNGGSASASEVLTGALLDHGIAVSVGEKSYGKGITQQVVPLKNKRALRYTNSKYLTPSGFSLHGVGLSPTYEVVLNPGVGLADIEKADPAVDNQLAKAIEVLFK